MTASKKRGCERCLFYEPPTEPEREHRGICRRHSPRVLIHAYEAVTYWPLVTPDDWCGEAKPTAEAQREDHKRWQAAWRKKMGGSDGS